MKKYDEEATCIKCGCGDIDDEHEKERSVEYAEAEERAWRNAYPDGKLRQRIELPHPEHIHRTCRNCEYVWDEAPIDAIELSSGINVMGRGSADIGNDPSADKPVIEVGDVVKATRGISRWVHEGAELEVTAVRADGIYGRLMGSNPVPLDALTLTHKGPKVHTFKGVIVRPLVEHDHIITQAINPNCYPNGLVELSGNGKRYTLTLTEEDTP